MGTRMEDSYGMVPVDLCVAFLTGSKLLSVTGMRPDGDEFVDLWTGDIHEIRAFFAMTDAAKLAFQAYVDSQG